MGCCCSCCCCKSSVEESQEYALSPQLDRGKTPSTGGEFERATAPQDTQSIPDDQPPPYEQESQEASSSTSRSKDLPYIIPLTSSTSPEDSLAAAYADDLSSWITKDQYYSFLAGLDRGLFASPTAEPGTASAYIQSMFQDQGWQSSVGAVDRSTAYLASQNTSLFRPKGIQVDILTTEQMKSRIDAASQAQIKRQETNDRINKIEGDRYEEELKLQQKLLSAKTIDRQQKAMRKFLEKDDKYNRKALKVVARAEREAGPSRTAEASSNGVYWLLVSQYPS